MVEINIKNIIFVLEGRKGVFWFVCYFSNRQNNAKFQSIRHFDIIKIKKWESKKSEICVHIYTYMCIPTTHLHVKILNPRGFIKICILITKKKKMTTKEQNQTTTIQTIKHICWHITSKFEWIFFSRFLFSFFCVVLILKFLWTKTTAKRIKILITYKRHINKLYICCVFVFCVLWLLSIFAFYSE